MIKIIQFVGGLGNQMFQYAFYLALKEKYPLCIFLFDINHCIHHHNGFELHRAFKLNIRSKILLFNIIYKINPKFRNNFSQLKQNLALQFQKEYLLHHSKRTEYIGWWQSELYFVDISQKVRESFLFNKDKLNNQSIKILKLINNYESVSVHIRRGDYLQTSIHKNCDTEYYYRSIQFIRNCIPDAYFFFFSDDIAWVKKTMNIDNAYFVECNAGNESWQDMFLMSQCKHNIIANSTFSWWGAWLNINPNKIIVAPQVWFNPDTKEDIVPKSWVRL